MIRNILLLFLLSLCCFGELSARPDGTYIVTRKAGKLDVYNHDHEVMGTLRPGDKIHVSLFLEDVSPHDSSRIVTLPVVSYKGHEGYLIIDEDDWLRSAVDPSQPVDELDSRERLQRDIKTALFFLLADLLLLFCVMRPLGIMQWTVRWYMYRKGAAIAMSLVALALFASEFYWIYTLHNPLWFITRWWIGVKGVVLALIGALVWVFAKLTLVRGLATSLAGLLKSSTSYFNYGVSFLIVFVGMWAMLIVGNWSVEWSGILQAVIGLVVVVWVAVKARRVVRMRGIATWALLVAVMVSGVAVLCYISLEAFKVILQIVILFYILNFIVQGLDRPSSVDNTASGNDTVNYFDYESGVYRQLHKTGDGSYVDLKDGSMWGKRGDSGDFNRFR